MTTKHTPGPWHTAGVVPQFHIVGGNPQELIADLLRALQFARRILGANDCGTDDVLGPIDEAIAKATGRKS